VTAGKTAPFGVRQVTQRGTSSMEKRKCNYPNCRKNAVVIIPFGYMGGSDAYCEKHQEKRMIIGLNRQRDEDKAKRNK